MVAHKPPVPLISKVSDISEALSIRQNLLPGDIGWLVWLHGVIYAREMGWDYTFEAYVAGPLAEFAIRRNEREAIWLVECSDRVGVASDYESRKLDTRSTLTALPDTNGEDTPAEAYPSIVGSVAVVEASSTDAQLRWLLLTPELRGQGVGRLLMSQALKFCKDKGYERLFLWTTSDLTDAARLYIAAGFRMTKEETRTIWGKFVTEQKFERELSDI